jgi:dynein heavy chain
MKGKDLEFITDTFEMPNTGTQKTLQNPAFLSMLINFSKNDKDNINEETIELLEPYLELK